MRNPQRSQSLYWAGTSGESFWGWRATEGGESMGERKLFKCNLDFSLRLRLSLLHSSQWLQPDTEALCLHSSVQASTSSAHWGVDESSCWELESSKDSFTPVYDGRCWAFGWNTSTWPELPHNMVTGFQWRDPVRKCVTSSGSQTFCSVLFAETVTNFCPGSRGWEIDSTSPCESSKILGEDVALEILLQTFWEDKLAVFSLF